MLLPFAVRIGTESLSTLRQKDAVYATHQGIIY